MPVLPRSARIYAGDIHTPQKVGAVQYVGAPHPVKFGDNYETRMLRLDDNFEIVEAIPLDTVQKLSLTLDSPADLYKVLVRAGDQAVVRVKLPLEAIDDWPARKAAVEAWAAAGGVDVARVEVLVETAAPLTDAQRVERAPGLTAIPQDVLIDFAAEEGLAEELLDTGIMLLEAAAALERNQ